MLPEGLPVQIQGAIFRQYPEKGSTGRLDIGGIDDGLSVTEGSGRPEDISNQLRVMQIRFYFVQHKAFKQRSCLPIGSRLIFSTFWRLIRIN
jgi:hypothetical protein